jgi:hypothetical protein
MKLDKSQQKEQITSFAHRHGEPAENRTYPGCERRNEVRRSDLQVLPVVVPRRRRRGWSPENRLPGRGPVSVYANAYTEAGEPDRAIGERRPGLQPVMAFLHANLRDEQSMREQFARVHICRRFALEL